MALKKLRSPAQAEYPVEIAQVFVQMGERIDKGVKLCKLRTGAGREMLIRAPLGGEVAEQPSSEGTILPEQAVLFVIDDAPEEVFAEVEEEAAEAERAAPRSRVRAPEPTPAAESREAETGAQVEKSERRVFSAFAGLVSVLICFALPLLAAYAALHVAHSVLPWYVGVGTVIGAVVLVTFVLGWVPHEGSVMAAVIAAFIALPAAAFTATMPLSTLQMLDSGWIHKQVEPVTGGPIAVKDGTLVVMGRKTTRRGQTAELWSVYRLGVGGAVLDKALIYTGDGRIVNPVEVFEERIGFETPSNWLDCLGSDFSRNLFVDGNTPSGTYADSVSFYFKHPDADRDLEGYRVKFDSAGEIVGVREHRPSRGAEGLLASCSTAARYDEWYGAPEL